MGYYEFGGTNFAVEDEPEPIAGFDPSKCGTVAGYKRHKRAEQEACADCLVGNAAYMRARTRARQKPAHERAVGIYNPDLCGGHNGYERHRRQNSIPCTPCREGHTKYAAERTAIRKAKAESRNVIGMR